MLSISYLLNGSKSGNEGLRHGHTRSNSLSAPQDGVPRPVVVWAVTRECNLRCAHCYASSDGGKAPGELSHDEGLSLLDDLKAFQVPAVLFSGGEPLVRPDTLELMQYAQTIGLNCTLSTNGLLIDEAMADRLAAMQLRYIGISLDGTRDRHDRLRGMAGAFDQTLAGIGRCVKRGIKVGLRFTVHSLNQGDLDSIFDTCIEQGIQRLCVYHLAYAGRGDNMKRLDLPAEGTRAIVDRIFERTRQAHAQGAELEVLTVGNHTDAAYMLQYLEQHHSERAADAWTLLQGTGGNRSGCNIASIDASGNVHYDQFSWHYSCGNVRQAPFSSIWSRADDPRLSILRDRQPHLPSRCQRCRYLSVCNGNLRTRAESATGDWLGQDPSCYLSDEEIAVSAA